MKKTIIGSLACFLSFLFGLLLLTTGCTQEPDPEKTLTIMGNSSNLQNPYIQRIFDLYEEKTGRELNIYAVDNMSYEEDVFREVEAADSPDIIMLFNNHLMTELGGTDRFVNLANQPWVADLEEDAKAYSSDTEGAILGLPFWESSISGVYYNKTILDELGLQPATTQEEFDQLCADLLNAGYTPLAIGDEGCYSLYQFGLDPLVADNPEILEQLNNGEITYSDLPEVRSMVAWLQHAHDAGWFGDTTSIPYEQLGYAMGNGDAVMTFVWDTWFDTDFKADTYTEEDFALMPVFIGTAEEGTYEGGNLNMFAVNKRSDKQDVALEFLEFCATPENYNEAFAGIATGNVFKGENTNIVSPMVAAMEEDIEAKGRTSTAEPKIKGYNARLMNKAVHQLYEGKINIDECLKLMDASLQDDTITDNLELEENIAAE